jgi:hypothetical protein
MPPTLAPHMHMHSLGFMFQPPFAMPWNLRGRMSQRLVHAMEETCRRPSQDAVAFRLPPAAALEANRFCSFAQGGKPALSGHGNTRAGPVLVLRYHHPTRGRLSESHTERYHFLPSFAQSLILKIAPTMSRHPFLRHKRRGARHQAGGCAAAL